MGHPNHRSFLSVFHVEHMLIKSVSTQSPLTVGLEDLVADLPENVSICESCNV
jgi:hypothetical protein